MDNWKPIAELKDRYNVNLLLCAPELVNLDCNPHGIAPGYWMDTSEEWIAAGYDMQSDLWKDCVCNPTHFIIMTGPADED